MNQNDMNTDFQSSLMTNNVLAYLIECCKENFPTEDLEKRVHAEMKATNFIPNLGSNCLYCDKKNNSKRCGKCRSVFFCDDECAKKAWPNHKKQCGRHLFTVCITCGKPDFSLLKSMKDGNKVGDHRSNFILCGFCPVRFCSIKCRDKLIEHHRENDCKKLSSSSFL